MAGLDNEDALGGGGEDATTDVVMATLNDPSSVQPDLEENHAPYDTVDTSRGVEGVDFGGMQAVKDKMTSVKNDVNDVLSGDWQPSAPSEYASAPTEATALPGTHLEEEPVTAGLS